MLLTTLYEKFYSFSLLERNLSPLTVKSYDLYLTMYREHVRISDIEEVAVSNVREMFHYGRSERQWSTSTYLNCYKALRVFFRWCIQEGYLQDNPTSYIELPKQARRLPKGLGVHEVQQIFKTINKYSYSKFLRYRNIAILATLIFTGIRKSELLNLHCTDIDLQSGSLFVRQGKGSKDRLIPINFELHKILKEYTATRIKVNKTCPEFFASSTYEMGFSDNGFRLLINKTSKLSGIKFTAHTLRHTFATLMLEGGCDIYSLSKLLGHTDIKTTTIYLGASIQHLRGQVSKHPFKYFHCK
jgi:site-specific recombinase XerD